MNSRGSEMIIKRPALFFASLVLILNISCSKDEGYGRLGIEVPVGAGKVTKTSPYIVIGIFENSPAYIAGIRPDDIIEQIDQQPLEGLEHDYIFNKLLKGKAGTKVTILVKRKDQKIVYEVMRGK